MPLLNVVYEWVDNTAMLCSIQCHCHHHHHHHHHHHRYSLILCTTLSIIFIYNIYLPYQSIYIYPINQSIYPADLRPANEFFHAKVQALVDEMEKRFQRVRHKYSYVLDYFGEDNMMRSQEFFTSLYKFIQEFSTVRDHIDRVKRAEAMVKKKM